MLTQNPDVTERLLSGSRVPEPSVDIPGRNDASLDGLFGDAHGVQHHGEESPQAVPVEQWYERYVVPD